MAGDGQDGVGIDPQDIGKAETGLRIGPSLACCPFAHPSCGNVQTARKVSARPVAAHELDAQPRGDVGVSQYGHPL